MVDSEEIRLSVIRSYCAGDTIDKVKSVVSPPLTSYMVYKILKIEGYSLRGKISNKKNTSENTILICKCCCNNKPAKDFSKHNGCIIGYDTSRCKSCKKSRNDWKNVTLTKKIFNRIKARAKLRNIEFNLELNDLIIPEKCPVFNREFIYNDPDWTYSVDRIDPLKGYVKTNIQIISNKANRLKNNATIEDIEKLLLWMKTLQLNER